MRDHSRRWGTVGGLLLATAGHGWIMLLGVAAILGVTYLAAYVLLHELKGRKIEGATIITPFLTIKAGLDDLNDAADADGKGAVAETGELKQGGGRVVTRAAREKRSAGKRSRRQCPARPSKRVTGAGWLQAFSTNPQNPYHSALDVHVLRLHGLYLIIWI